MIYEPVMNVSLDGNNSTLKTSSFVVICVKTMEINILYTHMRDFARIQKGRMDQRVDREFSAVL